MKDLDNMPKNITKAIRYIKQDANLETLKKANDLWTLAINKRLNELRKEA